MLIPFHEVLKQAKHYGIEVKGIFHVGAHECEEMDAYIQCGISKDDIVWVEGNSMIFNHMIKKGLRQLPQSREYKEISLKDKISIVK